MDCSLPGSSVYGILQARILELVTIAVSVCGILQARILEWVTIAVSKEPSQPRDQTQIFCIAGRFFAVWAARGFAG